MGGGPQVRLGTLGSNDLLAGGQVYLHTHDVEEPGPTGLLIDPAGAVPRSLSAPLLVLSSSGRDAV